MQCESNYIYLSSCTVNAQPTTTVAIELTLDLEDAYDAIIDKSSEVFDLP